MLATCRRKAIGMRFYSLNINIVMLFLYPIPFNPDEKISEYIRSGISCAIETLIISAFMNNTCLINPYTRTSNFWLPHCLIFYVRKYRQRFTSNEHIFTLAWQGMRNLMARPTSTDLAHCSSLSMANSMIKFGQLPAAWNMT